MPIRAELAPSLHRGGRPEKRPANPNVRLVPLSAKASTSAGATSKDATFGQRRSDTTARKRNSQSQRSSDHIVHKADGGVEFSWVPQSKSRKGDVDAMDVDGEGAVPNRKGQTRDKRKDVERFGAGMDNGGEDPDEPSLTEMERSGRKTRRKAVRSGSKNTFRRL